MTHCVEHQAKRSEDPSLFPITLISNQRITINLLHNYSILVFDDLETNAFPLIAPRKKKNWRGQRRINRR